MSCLTGSIIARGAARATVARTWQDRVHILQLDVIARYYQHARGGHDYLDRYFAARDATGSTDHLLKQNRFYVLYQMVRHVLRKQIAGDIAECGCWLGHSTYLMADLLAESGWCGRLWVFDSFEGLSDGTAKDRTQRGHTEAAAKVRDMLKKRSSLSAVQGALASYPFVSLHKGWIPEVFANVRRSDAQRFALVHIDVDLYQPTLESLRFFYPRMVKGGIIVVDDYGSTTFPGATIAVDEFMGEVDVPFFLEGHLQGAVLML